MLLSNRAMIGSNPENLYAFTNSVTTEWALRNNRDNWNKTGRLRNYHCGDANISGLTDRGSQPAGNTHPVAYVLAQKPGRIASHQLTEVSVNLSGNAALGSLIFTLSCVIGVDGTATGTLIIGSLIDGTVALIIDGSAVGMMTLSGAGEAVITITASGAILGHIPAAGAAPMEIGAVLNAAALGWLVGNGPITLDGSLLPYAVGWMQGTTQETGMTPTGVAAAVWNALAASYNLAGTMGERLNTAGGGSSPEDIADAVWDELQSGHIIPDSFGDLVAFIRNIEGGRWRITGNQMVFYKADNVTEVARFNLKSSSGTPTMTNVFERTRA